jgi:resuscitation-promoting factor RpfB
VPDPRTSPRLSSRVARIAARGLVLALVTGGSTAFAVLQKTVTVDVDGTTTEVSAFGRTVGDVLADAGIETGERDLVAPGLDQTIADGGEVVVRHGRQMTVQIDGETRTVWTTARTVGEAMGDLGVRDARASASRSADLGRDEVLRVSTEKTIHLAVDGQVVDGVTTAPTVREALQELGLVLAEGDRVSVPLDATAVDGLVVLVTRAAQGTVTITEELPFTETVVEDPTVPQGERRVQTAGQVGQRQITWTTHTVGGVEISRSLLGEAVVAEPVTQVVLLGTKPPEPEPAPAPAGPAAPARPARPSTPSAPAPPAADVTPGSAQAIARDMVTARGWGESQFDCLVRLWNKESGWRVDADNPSSSAYGIPQALPGSKMASAGADWRTNPATQITWGLGYIEGRYGTPCGAWSASQAKGWY